MRMRPLHFAAWSRRVAITCSAVSVVVGVHGETGRPSSCSDCSHEPANACRPNRTSLPPRTRRLASPCRPQPSCRAPPPSFSLASCRQGPPSPPASALRALALAPVAWRAWPSPWPAFAAAGSGFPAAGAAPRPPPRRTARAQLLALLGQQRHRLIQRDLLHHHAARQVGHRLAVLHIGTEAALADRHQLLVRRVRAERAHARHLARDQVHPAVDADASTSSSRSSEPKTAPMRT